MRDRKIENMFRRLKQKNITLFLALILGAIPFLVSCGNQEKTAESCCSNKTLKVGIAPYQEMALLMAEKNLGLEEKHGVKLEILTLQWEELLTSVASAGHTIDVGFGSLSDFLAKQEQLNTEKDDPVLYLYPAWVFHGGGLITFNKDVPEINSETIKDKKVLKKFLSFKFGVQKNGCSHKLLWKLAQLADVPFTQIKVTDTTLNDGFLAAEHGSVDMAGAGLTQRTEAVRRNGRVVLTMDTLGMVDPGGFVCKKSVYEKNKEAIHKLIHIWFESADYVLSDLKNHSKDTLAYLDAKSSTRYTLDELEAALAQEFVPRSVEEANKEIVLGTGKYSFARAFDDTCEYLIDQGITKAKAEPFEFISP